MRRAAILSVGFHLLLALALIMPSVPGFRRAPLEFAIPLAKVELVQQDTPVVGRAATAPEPPDAAPAEVLPRQFADAMPVPVPPPPQPRLPTPAAPDVRLGEDEASGTGLVTGPNVIAAGLDSRIHNMPPSYPRESARLGEGGVVLLMIHVAPDGTAAGVEVVESSGFARLDNAARRAVTRWQFRPAVQDGVPVASELPVRVTFALRGVQDDGTH